MYIYLMPILKIKKKIIEILVNFTVQFLSLKKETQVPFFLHSPSAQFYDLE